MIRCLAVVWLLWCALGVAAAAEELEFHAPAAAEGAATAKAMQSLAVRELPVYENPDRAEFLANLSALQMVAGEYPAAAATRDSLHDLREKEKTARPVDEALIYDLYAHARAAATRTGKPFAETFAQAFRAGVSPLDDGNAFTLTEWLETPLSVYRGNLQRELDRLQGKDRIPLDQAVDVIWTYLSFEAFRSFGPLTGKLIAADDARRYVLSSTEVGPPRGPRLEVVVVRPRSAAAPIPALLELTDGADSRDEARECAAHGYAGVIAHPRPVGDAADKRKSSESAGAGARVAIDWIARQRWSNGRVGLYANGDGASVALAMAERPPAALKALAASSVTLSARALRAALRVGARGLPDRRRRGRSASAQLAVPALTTTGYFDSAEAASLVYFDAHGRVHSGAVQRLLIGPYDSQAMQRGTLPVLGGYSIDQAAIIDLRALRFAWFDHVLEGAPLPPLLANRVNFEVMGADTWRHVASVAAMANWKVRLYPDASPTVGHYGLSGHEPPRQPLVEQPVRLSASAPGDAVDLAAGIVTPALAPGEDAVFVSGPLHRPLEVSGRVTGELVFEGQSAGVTAAVDLYELRPGGDYFRFLSISDAHCGSCASRPSRDRRSRERLSRLERRSGLRRVDFESERVTSTELHTGSRIVLVLVASVRAPEHARTARHSRSARHVSPPADPVRASTARGRPQERMARLFPEVRWLGGTFIELPIWR
ncbi:MAG: CocE/NonD family hydrolase [Steroidobacteraceae bacterium]